jgi:SNF2 family DNA or RNA helicase
LLIVCPTSVIGTWAEQAARFVPQLRVATVTETRARRGLDLATIAADADLVVTSYTLLRLEERDYHALQWSGMVLDEAQAVKNYRAKTYQSVRRVPAPFRLAVTGTPLENSLMDLWSLLSIVAPGLYPDPVQFTDEYRRPIESGADPEQLTRLRRRIRPLMLRRTKHEVAPELPPKQEQVLHVDLAPAHRRVYSKHLQRERQRVLGMLDDVQKNRIAIFRALTMLRQLSLAPSLVDDDYAAIEASKIDVLMGQVREVVAEGHRALVFSQFTGFLKLVRTRLEAAGIGYSYLDGRTRDRAARIAAFREGDDPLFLISLKAGGFGLTLTEADYVFILDPWWNPAAEEQAIDRTHRIGQDKTVMVYRLVATDTIEEKVVALQDRKRRLFADVVGAEGLLGAPLTPDDIRGLFEP